jgi:hypothetical protein
MRRSHLIRLLWTVVLVLVISYLMVLLGSR